MTNTENATTAQTTCTYDGTHCGGGEPVAFYDTEGGDRRYLCRGCFDHFGAQSYCTMIETPATPAYDAMLARVAQRKLLDAGVSIEIGQPVKVMDAPGYEDFEGTFSGFHQVSPDAPRVAIILDLDKDVFVVPDHCVRPIDVSTTTKQLPANAPHILPLFTAAVAAWELMQDILTDIDDSRDPNYKRAALAAQLLTGQMTVEQVRPHVPYMPN